MEAMMRRLAAMVVVLSLLAAWTGAADEVLTFTMETAEVTAQPGTTADVAKSIQVPAGIGMVGWSLTADSDTKAWVAHISFGQSTDYDSVVLQGPGTHAVTYAEGQRTTLTAGTLTLTLKVVNTSTSPVTAKGQLRVWFLDLLNP